MQLVLSRFIYAFSVLLLRCFCVFSPGTQPVFLVEGNPQQSCNQQRVVQALNQDAGCVQDRLTKAMPLHFSLCKSCYYSVRLHAHDCFGETICLKDARHSRHFTLLTSRKCYAPATTTFKVKNDCDKFISENEEEDEETASLRKNGDAANYFIASSAQTSQQYFCHYIKTCLTSLKHFDCTPSNRHLVLCVMLI